MRGVMLSVTVRSGKWKSSSQQFLILDNKSLQRAEKWAEPVALDLEVTYLGEQLHHCFHNNFSLSAKKICELFSSKNLKNQQQGSYNAFEFYNIILIVCWLIHRAPGTGCRWSQSFAKGCWDQSSFVSDLSRDGGSEHCLVGFVGRGDTQHSCHRYHMPLEEGPGAFKSNFASELLKISVRSRRYKQQKSNCISIL